MIITTLTEGDGREKMKLLGEKSSKKKLVD